MQKEIFKLTIIYFSFKQRLLQTSPQLLAAPPMTTRLTHILFIWPLLLLFSFSLYLLLFTFSWLVLEKVCMQFKMFALDNVNVWFHGFLKGFSTSRYMNPPCISSSVISLGVTYTLHESLSIAKCFKKTWGGGGREGGGTVSLLWCWFYTAETAFYHSILPSQIQLSHIDVDETHRPWSFKQCTGGLISKKRTGWIAASIFSGKGL